MEELVVEMLEIPPPGGQISQADFKNVKNQMSWSGVQQQQLN